MKIKPITFVFLLGLWTALTLGGSIWGFLVIAGPNSVSRYSNIRLDIIASENMKLIMMLIVYPCGGGLWGWGIARLMKADAKSIMTSGALSWGITMIAMVMAVVLMATSQGVGFSKINFLPHFPHYRHYNFLLVFVTAVGIITAVNAYVVTGKLGLKQLRKSVGMYSGFAAAVGFLVVGLILFLGFGWEVGSRIPGMLTVLLICSIGGALAGGMSLGWMLSRAGSTQE